MIEFIQLLIKIEFLKQGKIKLARYTEKPIDEMNLDELNDGANTLRLERDAITIKLREYVKAIDKLTAKNQVADIVSGLSEDQKREMYAQIVGVSTAGSESVASSAKGSK